METEEQKAGAGMRILALVMGVLLLFGAAVMALVVINPDDIPLCSDRAAALAAGECFDVSKTQDTISTILAVPAGILAAIAGLLGFYVAFTGRRAQQMLKLGGAAVALGILTYVINSV
jgi:hypothetical protein